jgi:glycosyltransferase involved in cell wall biosynthesis
VDTSDRERFDAPVFVPIKDSNLNPIRRVRSPRVIGYCFTEWPIGENAHRVARQYDVLFAGSTWNAWRLWQRDIPAEVLHQGIDFDRFKLQPPSERKGFVVFSGGKYEFRKGQDYVVAAMKHFMAVHPDAVLIAAWHNQWPASMASMQHSWLLEDWQKPFDGLPEDRVFRIPAMRNEQTPALYAQAHIGVFPNRCEAGTNLVMCEFMASGRPVIATDATGQRDVFRLLGAPLTPALSPPRGEGEAGSSAYLLTNGTYDPAGWFNCHVSDIIANLEHAYQHRAELQTRGIECRHLVERFTWRACAEKIFNAAFSQRSEAALRA